MGQIFKNLAQKVRVFAFADAGHATLDPGEPVTGDAANISAKTAVDNAALGTSNDVAPAEVSATDAPGFYEFDATTGETDGSVVEWYPKSSTAGVQVVTVGGNTQTTIPRYFPVMGIESDGHAHADLKEWLGVAPLALQSQRVNSYVGSMAANVITAAAIATDAITAAKIAANAIGASELATDAVTEIQSGLATAAAQLTQANIRTAIGMATNDLDTQLGTLATQALLTTVAGYLDTEIAAILAKTNLIPADPATETTLATLATSTALTAAKAVIDQLLIDVAENQTDLDLVLSTGSTGPWTTGGGGDATAANQAAISALIGTPTDLGGGLSTLAGNASDILARGNAAWVTGGGGAAPVQLVGGWGYDGSSYFWNASVLESGTILSSGLSAPAVVGVFGNNAEDDLGYVESTAPTVGTNASLYGAFTLASAPAKGVPAYIEITFVYNTVTYTGRLFSWVTA